MQGLEKFIHRSDLWRLIGQWKTIADSISSGSSKKRIFVVSSSFLQMYSNHHPKHSLIVHNQFDLVDHFLHVDHPDDIADQIKQGLRWDNDIGKPWILWNLGSHGKPRLANLLPGRSDCTPTMGILMLAMSLPGSVSVLYGDEIGLHNTTFAGDETDSSALMRWTEDSGPANSLSAPAGRCFIASVRTFGRLSAIRKDAVPLHTNAVLKFDKQVLESRTFNYLCQVHSNSTVVIERYYPRRHRYLLITNLSSRNVTHNLSNIYFGGLTLVSSTGNKEGYIKLNALHLQPAEGLLLLLDR